MVRAEQGTRSERRQYCTGVCEETTWVREAEESPLLGAVTRKRQVILENTRLLCPGELWSVEMAIVL
jgi:hypothetical protein